MNWFQKLLDCAEHPDEKTNAKLGEWSCRLTEEQCSLYIENNSGNKLYIVAGRKIISSENLEVLALATNNTHFSDGLPLADIIKTILSDGSIPLIPWAVGKWLGNRGQVLDKIIANFDPHQYFLCDNSNRPFFWPRPRQFKVVEAHGGRILSGSDPLHFCSEIDKVGSFGCWVERPFDQNFPAKTLKSILNDPSIELHLYGKLEKPIPFFRNQIYMQLLKKKWKKQYYQS